MRSECSVPEVGPGERPPLARCTRGSANTLRLIGGQGFVCAALCPCNSASLYEANAASVPQAARDRHPQHWNPTTPSKYQWHRHEHKDSAGTCRRRLAVEAQVPPGVLCELKAWPAPDLRTTTSHQSPGPRTRRPDTTHSHRCARHFCRAPHTAPRHPKGVPPTGPRGRRTPSSTKLANCTRRRSCPCPCPWPFRWCGGTRSRQVRPPRGRFRQGRPHLDKPLSAVRLTITCSSGKMDDRYPPPPRRDDLGHQERNFPKLYS